MTLVRIPPAAPFGLTNFLLAAARVPIEIGRDTNLLGTPSMIAERVRAYRAAGITTLQAKTAGTLQERIDTVAELIDVLSRSKR